MRLIANLSSHLPITSSRDTPGFFGVTGAWAVRLKLAEPAAVGCCGTSVLESIVATRSGTFATGGTAAAGEIGCAGGVATGKDGAWLGDWDCGGAIGATGTSGAPAG